MDRIRTHLVAVLVLSLVGGACTGTLGGDSAGDASVPDVAAVPIPSPGPETANATPSLRRGTVVSLPPRNPSTPLVAVIDTDGQLGIVDAGVVQNAWMKFTAHPTPDRTAAVMTLGPQIEGIGPERPVVWVHLPSGEPVGEQVMRSDSELTATSLDGTFAGFTTRAGESIDGAIAGTRRTSRVQVISRDEGVVFDHELEGNVEPEAFGSRLTDDGVPALVFLLEYFPADIPRFYRVRVLSTETGEVSLPLDLRDKQQQVDERMAGFSRSQVVANDHGLLFTLYRGTIDGTPDGEPYAFVHTLDFADGVWCLDVDPRLELERLPGSLAVGGDRLYVASANGKVGSYPIPSITDPELSPTMDWVVDVVGASDEAPVITADAEAVHVADPDRPGRTAHVHATGLAHPPTEMFAGAPTAFDRYEGELHAIGDDWATFPIISRPDWLDEIDILVVD